MLRASNHIPTCTAPNVRVNTSGNKMATSKASDPRSLRRSKARRTAKRLGSVTVKIRVLRWKRGESESGPGRGLGRTWIRDSGVMTVLLVSANLVLVVQDRVED